MSRQKQKTLGLLLMFVGLILLPITLSYVPNKMSELSANPYSTIAFICSLLAVMIGYRFLSKDWDQTRVEG